MTTLKILFSLLLGLENALQLLHISRTCHLHLCGTILTFCTLNEKLWPSPWKSCLSDCPETIHGNCFIFSGLINITWYLCIYRDILMFWPLTLILTFILKILSGLLVGNYNWQQLHISARWFWPLSLILWPSPWTYSHCQGRPFLYETCTLWLFWPFDPLLEIMNFTLKMLSLSLLRNYKGQLFYNFRTST